MFLSHLTVKGNRAGQLDERNIVDEEEGAPVFMDEEVSARHGDLRSFILADVVGTHDHLHEAGTETQTTLMLVSVQWGKVGYMR